MGEKGPTEVDMCDGEQQLRLMLGRGRVWGELWR
jgi:hypothetical protein